MADTGAQTRSVMSECCRKLGLKPEDYLPTEVGVTGASGGQCDVKGCILAAITVGIRTTHQIMYVIDNDVGNVLSREALIILGIINVDFPKPLATPTLY